MRVAAGLCAVLVAVFGVPFIRSGWREWRHAGGSTPLSQRYGLLVDKQTRAAMDRSGLIMGLAFAFMAIMLADFAIINFQHPIKAEALAIAAAVAGMTVCWALYFLILMLNRPKFLVPPQHRSEPEALFAQRRRREGRHARHDAGRQAQVDGEAAAGGPAVSLLAGERVSARLVTNHIRDGRSFEGYLYVTTQRLVYIPWPAAEARGATPFSIPLAEVSGADVAPRGTNWRDGSWRQRLRVTISSGDAELFVVWRAQRAADLIEQARQGRLG